MFFSSKCAAFLLLVLLAISIPAAAQSGPSAGCTPKFVPAQGWQGADAAYSIPLPSGKVVWIFGDTLYGEQRVAEAGKDPRMVRNSIGISTCDKSEWKLDYVIRHNAEGKQLDFFPSADPKHWYWALDGVYYNKELWVTLLCVRNTDKSVFELGFEVCGADLARVSGLDRDPQQWKVTISKLVPDGTRSYPSASTVISGKYLYIYSLVEFGTRPEALTRIPLNKLSQAQENLEYLAADGTWKKGFDPKTAKTVMEPGASEMSVRYHADLKKWVAVMVDPFMFSDKVYFRTAGQMEGPWTPSEVIYRIPEMDKSRAGYDKDTYCYAGKEHPEFEMPGELIFTYTCNTMKPEKLLTEPNIYFPQVVKMQMPGTSSAAPTK